MKKPNLRSIRLSDEVLQVIDCQVGNSFSQRFENLVTRCMWEIPEKERQLAELDREILKRQEILKKMNQNLLSNIAECENLVHTVLNKLLLVESEL